MSKSQAKKFEEMLQSFRTEMINRMDKIDNKVDKLENKFDKRINNLVNEMNAKMTLWGGGIVAASIASVIVHWAI